ncbi:hypothetical protein K144316041_p20560 (plasmid) [Clostridium tetani]|uniref:hypothetical protein n=1 Tax=Clostridium tetani TaxID=1513 RepID=UPI0029531E2A|nr:hypothetical protein [Clostridium tetani]BDR74217.1 hypothetical protein K144316041_p20560 [Clostridium tetani]
MKCPICRNNYANTTYPFGSTYCNKCGFDEDLYTKDEYIFLKALALFKEHPNQISVNLLKRHLRISTITANKIIEKFKRTN